MVSMATCIYVFMWTYLARVNRQRAAGKIEKKHEGLNEEELAELGDDSPRFRYVI